MSNASGLTAGFVLIIVAVACACAGVLVGGVAGSRVLGGLVGGVVGVVLGFYAVYRLYLVPFREQSLRRDYSKLQPRIDHDE